MENEKLTTRLGSVAFRTTGRHSSFRRFCELFEINLGKAFDKDADMSTDLSAHLSDSKSLQEFMSQIITGINLRRISVNFWEEKLKRYWKL